MTVISKHFGNKVIAIFISAVSIWFIACKKSNESLPEKSNLAIVDASVGGWQLDFRINGVIYNQKALKYDTILPYAGVAAGTQTFSLALSDDARVLINAPVNLRKDRYYTVFIASLKDLPYAPLFVVTQEDLTTVADKAKIRFVNVGSDTRPVNLHLRGTDTPLFEQLPFREATLFKNLPANDHYNFQIKERAQDTALATLNDVKLENGKLYTIYVKGFKSDNDDPARKLKLGIINNK